MLSFEPNDGYEKYLSDKAFANSIPLSGTFELLPICNMNCDMCYVRLSVEEMNSVGSPLKVEEWIHIGKEAADQGTLFVLLTGGEPLLYPEFKKLYKELRKLGLIITINTNGTLIDESVVEMFQEDLPRRVNISLYGSNNETYERLCHNPNGFTQVMHAIHMLKDAKIPMKLNYTVTPENKCDLEEILKITDELGIPVSIPSYIFPPERKKGIANQLDKFKRFTPEEAAKTRMDVIRYTYSKDNNYLKRIHAMLDDMKPKTSEGMEQATVPPGLLCTAGTSSFWVSWRGEMTPCGMMNTPKIKLTEESFETCWNTIKSATQKLCTSNRCFHCRFRRICLNCGASSYAENGVYDSSVEYHCKLCEEFERLLKEEIAMLEVKDEDK